MNKQKMQAATAPAKGFGFDWKDPWEIGFAALLTMAEEFLRSDRTGRSSTGMVIIDHEPRYLDVVRDQSRQRREGGGWRQIRKVMEIGYSAASHANPMIQLTDLIAFTMKKGAESNAGFGSQWPAAAHAFFQTCRDLVWDRVEFKMLKFDKLAVPDEFTDYLKEIQASHGSASHIAFDVSDGVDPVLGNLDPRLDTRVLREQVQESTAPGSLGHPTSAWMMAREVVQDGGGGGEETLRRRAPVVGQAQDRRGDAAAAR